MYIYHYAAHICGGVPRPLRKSGKRDIIKYVCRIHFMDRQESSRLFYTKVKPEAPKMRFGDCFRNTF